MSCTKRKLTFEKIKNRKNYIESGGRGVVYQLRLSLPPQRGTNITGCVVSDISLEINV